MTFASSRTRFAGSASPESLVVTKLAPEYPLVMVKGKVYGTALINA